MTTLVLSKADRVCMDIRFNFNQSPMPWDDCVFEVIDRLDAPLDEDARAELIERLVELGPVPSEQLLPVVEEYIHE